MADETRVALVGAGAMGAKHARVMSESLEARVDVIIDQDLARATHVARECGAQASSRLSDALHCDAVVLATASHVHAPIAQRLLNDGMPLLVEKPLATALDDVVSLCETARVVGSVLMCGFVERFNPAFTALAALLDGPPIHVSSQRYSPRNDRASSGVVDDLLIHDIDLLLQLYPADTLTDVEARCWRPSSGTWEETVDALVAFAGGATAALSASRAHQRKVRNLLVTTSSRTFEVDMLRRCVTVYRNITESDTASISGYTAQTVMDIPFIRSAGEPLALQFAHFLALLADPAAAALELSGLVPPHAVAADVLASGSRAARGQEVRV